VIKTIIWLVVYFIKILLLSLLSLWPSYKFGRLIRIDGKYRHSCYLKKITFYALNFKFIIKILLVNKKFGRTHIELFCFSSSVIKFLWFCILEIQAWLVIIHPINNIERVSSLLSFFCRVRTPELLLEFL
jgi:hypothetical protein